MIKTVKVTNHRNESFTFNLRHPYGSGMFIASIDGLGPVKAIVNVSEQSTDDGGRFNSARLEKRNIVFTIGYFEEPTIEEARLKSYKYFPIKQEIKLEFDMGTKIVQTRGIVEANAPDIFSRQAATQISVVCPDPYFYSIGGQTTTLAGVESMFHFPFSNESLTENLIILSENRTTQSQSLLYKGDFDIGIQINIHATDTVTNLTIYNLTTKESMSIDTQKLVELTGQGIINGDDILISTDRFSKFITLIRGGEHYNIINALGKDTDWFKLIKGENVFVYTTDVGAADVEFRITNKTAYEGI